VIVTCERCETEFQLDDARVPMSGARVRCSRCKHAFFVLPPAATRDQAIDQAASAALADDPAPGITEDLPGAPGAPSGADPAEGDGDDSESDWQFNGDLPADPGDSSPDLHVSGLARAAQPADLATGDPESDADSGPSLELASEPERTPAPARVAASEPQTPDPAEEDLGSPVDWDFFDKPAQPTPPAATAPQRAGARALVIPLDIAREPEARRDVPVALRRAVDAAGWLAVLGLCAVALARGLAPPAPVETSWPAPAPGLALADVRAHWLDNASLGRLYVVSGRVENQTPEVAALPPLALELRDESGRPIGAPIPLRGAGPAERLREADAGALAASGSDVPGDLAPGVSWAFEVVAWPLPANAARFAIR
jgi:predicted Zn finger-like uncharacterized protein